LPVAQDAAEGLYRLVDAAYEEGSVAISSNLHYLFVPGINTERIEAFLNDRMRMLDGDNWRDLAEKIARIGSWEFEDCNADREQ
jgi:hypothetical protein